MNQGLRAVYAVAAFALLLCTCGFVAAPSHTAVPDFIVTSASAYDPLAALHGGERFPKGAQLLLVRDGKAEPLVSGFDAAADASVSFDAQSVVFDGKKTASDPWQIYLLTMADRSIRQITVGPADSIRPLFLPAGRIVYARRNGAMFQLHTLRMDNVAAFNSGEPTTTPVDLPITFLASSAFPADVLADGRILFESNFPLGSGESPEIYLVYSDGSGVESYRCDHGNARWGAHQLASGDVVFTHGSSLARFTSPLAHEERMAAPAGTYAGDVAETATGEWLVSAKATSAAPYAIRFWKLGSPAARLLLQIAGQNLIEPVLLAPRPRPHRHPSALHPWDYANLLALDARVSRDGDLKSAPATVRVETQDASGQILPLGTAPIEQDGSFFVKIPGDKPIRFAVLDARGTVLRQEHGWFWSRAGEQRYCVGCHAGPERAPENRVPAVLLHTTDPVDLTKPASSQTIAAGGR